MATTEQLKKLLGKDYESFLIAKIAKRAIWVGPFTFDTLLDHSLDSDFPKLPESQSVYIVSRKAWVLFMLRPRLACALPVRALLHGHTNPPTDEV